MDTSFWKTINSVIVFKETKKQFWGQYLWRLEIHAKCANVACSEDPEHAVEILKFQTLNRNNYGGSWRNPYWHNYTGKYDNVDFGLLQSIKNIKENFSNMARTRIEDCSVQFYAENENDLKLICKLLPQHCVQAVTGPRAGTEQLLISNAIIAPKIAFNYKVVLRDGQYNVPLKLQILNLLENQEDIKITAGLKHNLNRPWPAMWGVFFYTNDLGIVTMLNLMSPGIVGKIHEVVQA
jgi:hypothetical protein